LSFSAYAVPVDAFGDRSSVAITLVLTTIAFKLYVANELPKVPYLTSIDWYMIGSFMTQMIVYAVQGFPVLFRAEGLGVIHLTLEADEHEKFDKVSAFVIGGLWFLFNLVWHVAVFWHVRSNKIQLGDPVF